MGNYKQIVTYMFWEDREEDKKGLPFILYMQLINKPSQKTIDDSIITLNSQMKETPSKAQFIEAQIKSLNQVNLNEFKVLRGKIVRKCNKLVQAKNRDINKIIQNLTGGLTKKRFEALTLNPTEEEKEKQIIAVTNEIQMIKKKQKIRPSDRTECKCLGKEVECLSKLDLEEFKKTTAYLFFKSWIDKQKKLNPDEETNGK